MTYRLRLRLEAEAEILETRDWYETRRDGLGTEFTQALDEAMRRLAAQPEMYQRVHGEIRRAVLR